MRRSFAPLVLLVLLLMKVQSGKAMSDSLHEWLFAQVTHCVPLVRFENPICKLLAYCMGKETLQGFLSDLIENVFLQCPA
jgi:hypothetical protein